jgi:peptidyl-dipeptidase Dcp
VDEQALRPYFELDRVLTDGVFFAATSLYGITFHERTDLAGYHPDVRVWEVRNEDGSALGLFLGDYYTRASKRGGAWMNSLVEQSELLGTAPVVINNLNISKPPAGEPTLLTLDELRTDVPRVRPRPARTVLQRDLSEVLRHSCSPRFRGVPVPGQRNVDHVAGGACQLREALQATGEPLPQDVVDKLNESRLWGEGFATTEYLGAALLDLAWHVLEPAGT